MSLLTEVSKTVVDATAAFTSLTDSGISSRARAQPYIQVGDPISIPDSLTDNTTFFLGAFDAATTTYAYPVVLQSGAAEVHIYVNSAAAGAPPNFSLATTLLVMGAFGVTYFAQVQLSSNGLVCVFGANYTAADAGIVAVFTRPTISSQAWTQVATVTGTPGSGLGDAVSISADGPVIAVGVWNLNANAGSTNVYNFNAATGALMLVATLVGTGAVGPANQGYFVTLSGDGMTLAVSGPVDDGDKGAVWMFQMVSGTWTQMGPKLAPHNASATAFFGTTVALSYNGTLLAVGSSNAVAQNSGCVFTFNSVNGAWAQGQTIYPLLSTALTAPSIQLVTLNDDGNVLVFDQSNYNTGNGAVFVYNLQKNGLWVQNGDARVATGTLFPGNHSTFHLTATSRTGSMFAITNLASPTPTNPSAFAIFQ